MLPFTLRLKPVNLTLGDYGVFRQRPLTLPGFRLKSKRLVLEGQFPRIAIKATLNVFQQLSPSETQHSRILCDLLDPNNPANKYGKVFLDLFFKMVLKDPDFIPDTGDRWVVSAEKERIDVYIRNQDHSKIIILENKSNFAGDQPHQLYRYWYWGIYRKQEGSKKYAKILYVSPADYKQPSPQTLSRPENPSDLYLQKFTEDLPRTIEDKVKTIFFKPDITDWLEACLNTVKETEDMSFYIKQYRDYCDHDFWRSIMTQETIKQVDEYFTDLEVWNSFVELNQQKNTITVAWCSRLREALNKCFAVENIVDKWGYASPDQWNYRWYLREYASGGPWGSDSLCLWLSGQNLHLWANPTVVDMPKISALLQTPKYAPIIGAFDNQHEQHIAEPDNQYKVIERGNYTFGDTEDGHLSADKFVWYARYRTDDLARQILEKINRFRTPEITALFEEINREAKK